MSDVPEVNYQTPSMVDLFVELRGQQVVLRPYQESDALPLFEAVEESRDYLSQWINFPKRHVTLAQTQEWIVQQQANWSFCSDLSTAVWSTNSGEYLGDCRVYPHSWETRYFSLSYWLRHSASGKGYMSEAVTLWSDFAFDQLQASRLEIRCDVRNDRSAALARRCGFVQEGILRNHLLAPDGTLRASQIFSRIPTDPRP